MISSLDAPRTVLQAEPRTDHRPLFALLGATAISLAGSMLSLVALPWFVLQSTGSPARAGLVGLATILPGFLAGVFGGALVDRLGFRRISVTADIVSGLAIGSIPLLSDTVGLAFWQLLALVFLGGLLNVPGLTARRSLLPELAASAGMRLERANAVFESISNLAMLIGPPIAGLLIGLLGARNVLGLDAASFAASALLIGVLVPRPPAPAGPAERSSYLSELMTGLRFIRRERLLFPMAIFLALSNGLMAGFFDVLLPVFARQAYGRATVLGVLVAAAGAGAFLGAIAFGAVGHRISRSVVWLGAFSLMSLEFWVLAAAPPLPVILAVLVVAGFASGPINPLMVTIRHERSPIHLRGRVFSTYSAIAMAVQPLGIVASGFLVEGIGLRMTVLLIAVLIQALGAVMLFIPAFRAMQSPAPVDAALA